MSSLLPVGYKGVCPDPNLNIGIAREITWHTSVVDTYFKQDTWSGIFYGIGHCVVALSLYIPGLSSLIYYVTYFALTYLHPDHLEATYQLALEQGNLEGARVCLDRGASANLTTTEGKNILDLLSEKIVKGAVQSDLNFAYDLIEKGIEVLSPDAFPKKRLLWWTCKQEKLSAMRELMKRGVEFGDWKEACSYIKPKPEAPLKSIVPKELTFCLTDLALEPLPLFAGRFKELTALAQIFQSRSKKNPIIVGKPGVGKTALVHKFAHMIQKDERFPNLSGKRILHFDLHALNSGDKKAVEQLQVFLKKHSGTFILFIDNVHLLLPQERKRGKQSESLFDSFLRLFFHPYPCILATRDKFASQMGDNPQIKEQGEFFELESPSGKEAAAILFTAAKGIEEHYNIQIDREAISEAITLCMRFLPDRVQPQVGIEVLERAARGIASQHSQGPFSLQEARRQLAELHMKQIVSPHADQKAQIAELEAKVKRLETKMSTLKLLFKEQDKLFFLMAANQLGEEDSFPCQELVTASEEQVRVLTGELGEEFELVETVNTEAVRSVVSEISRVPLNRLSEGQREVLLSANAFLSQRVIGQPHAVSLVVQAIQRAGVQLTSNRPLGSFLFVGLSGGGKSELARVLAELFFGSRDAVFFIPMGQYQERHNVSNLTGVPPGYVGADTEGKLTRELRRKPRQVLVFDEAEKAHSSFWDLLLTICDEGFYKDTSTGEKVDCRHAFIVLTSNAGAKEFLAEVSKIHQRAEEQCARLEAQAQAKGGMFSSWRASPADEPLVDVEEEINELCRFESVANIFTTQLYKTFRVEFLNRLTLIPFLPIRDRAIICQIALKHLEVEKRYFAQSEYRLQIQWGEHFVSHLVTLGSDLKSGMRPIRNFLEDTVRGEISSMILSGKVKKGHKIEYVGVLEDKPIIRVIREEGMDS